MPVALAGTFLIFFRTFGFDADAMRVILLILAVSVVSAFYRFRYSIRERFRALNKEIEEIKRMENE